jgi:hypothetical protein
MLDQECKILITQDGIKIGFLSIPYYELDDNPNYKRINIFGKPIPFDWLPMNSYTKFTRRITSNNDVILILD